MIASFWTKRVQFLIKFKKKKNKLQKTIFQLKNLLDFKNDNKMQPIELKKQWIKKEVDNLIFKKTKNKNQMIIKRDLK